MPPPEFDEEFYLAANPDVAMAVRAGQFTTGREHYERYGSTEGRAAVPTEGWRGPRTDHRRVTRKVLRGAGLEIGAFDSPCPVPDACTVTFCDRHTVKDARCLFPELVNTALQPPDVLVDLDRTGLSGFQDASQDFVILNHVIEHVANPIAVMGELFRVTRPGGHVVIGVPDHRYTFDRARGKTPFEHLKTEFDERVTDVSLAHYFDIIALASPDTVQGGVHAIQRRALELRARAEHAHVWDGPSFQDFLDRCLALHGVSATTVFEVGAEDTGHEYFAVLEKR